MQLSRMSSSTTLHRGPMDRLTTLNRLSVFSACILLLAQIQIFHALPTTGFSSPLLRNTQITSQTSDNYAPLSSSAYDSSYQYRSYRPGARLNDPYRPYNSNIQGGLYAQETLHPNSVYSRQSTSPESVSPQELEKVLKFLEKEVEGSDYPREAKEIPSAPLPSDKNKPKLAPLVPPAMLEKKQVDNNKENAKVEQTFPSSSSTLETSVDPLHPPPFAPEFDPDYERKQYGLGPLTLLDQAGPFW